MRHINLKIYGRVQGVFFRYNTKKMADRLKLKGFVKNCPDETVEILAEGDDESLDKLISWCKKGPIGSIVEKVEMKEGKYKKEFKDFSIVY